MHLASPPPDAKGNFCSATVKDASVLGCVASVPPTVRQPLCPYPAASKPRSEVCNAAVQWCCSSSSFLSATWVVEKGDPRTDTLSSIAVFCSSGGNPELDHHPSLAEVPASLLPFHHWDGGRGHLVDSWGYRNSCLHKTAAHFPFLLLRDMCWCKAIGNRFSSGRCLTSEKLCTVLFLCSVTRITSLNVFLMKRSISKGR